MIDGNKVRYLRESLNITVTELAAAAKITQAHMSYVEQGYNQPSGAVWGRIADYLGVTMDDLRKSEDREHATREAAACEPCTDDVGETGVSHHG